MANADGFTTVDSLPRPVTRTTASTPNLGINHSVALPLNHAAILAAFGAGHVIVDAICAAGVTHAISSNAAHRDFYLGMFFLYHALAFGLEAIFGLAVDLTNRPRLAAVLGCLITMSILGISDSPMLLAIIAGVGNALFHVGGGVICLRLTPDRATAPGIFVAPGSFGLFLGVILGKHASFEAWLALAVIALIIIAMMAWVPIPEKQPWKKTEKIAGRGEMALGLILLSIMVRSLLGFLVSFPWDTQPVALIALTMATMAGKIVGGILADRFGWLRVGVGAMLASVPFLTCCLDFPWAAIPGLFLLNIAMPVTLVATVKALPGYPGFAFGLTCIAILLGAIPTHLDSGIHQPWIVVAVLLFSAAGLYRGLQLLLDRPALRKEAEE